MNEAMEGKSILITGGTGTLGHALVRLILKKHKPRRLIVFSRDEAKQDDMRQEFDGGPMRYFIGDVRDLERVKMAFRPVDWVIHAAALKHVPSGETNPIEVKKTNVDGSQNVITAAIECGVQRVMAVSTDKAVNPVNLYGATKMTMERLMIEANVLSGDGGCEFSVCRYGNVFGSRGSVVPLFRKLAANRAFPITDVRMTRFFITQAKAAEFVADRLQHMRGGEIYIPKMQSTGILDLAHAIGGRDCVCNTVGIRPGEKIDETLISSEETGAVHDCGLHYAIVPRMDWYEQEWPEPLPSGFKFDSALAPRMSEETIRRMLDENDS